ncbi:MAG: hypothetical protein IT376_05905 [Polyangiaceae bacterium]|nr:hypothetical protein [Polyangiaceae bacterium]
MAREPLWRFVADRYDRRGLLALALLVTVGGAVGYRWSDLLDANAGVDLLLAGTWAFMAAAIAWDASWERDLPLLAAGLAGGALIETWGTVTSLWTYFTAERPPLWILPAWPIAALVVERIALVLGHLAPASPGRPERRVGGWVAAYWILLPSFVAWMTWFAWHTVGTPATQLVIGVMVFVLVRVRDPRADVLRFVGGALLGVALEYWGTSRQCWTYYTHEVPPAVAVVAHGFAGVAFARAAERARAWLGWSRAPHAIAAPNP